MKKLYGTLALVGLLAQSLIAQTTLSLNDLSAFQNPSANWSVVGSVRGSLSSDNFNTTPGTGVLVNTKPAKLYQAQDNLLTKLQHGDLRLELDFMMPKGSNSGIYLMGRYEVQLFDSWQAKYPKYSDCGGIYERWDDTRPEGQKGYEGHRPRQNVCRAPGLWQHLEIDFQAPQFDASGRKIKNARFAKVVLNGITIHENVELSGPTRAAAFTNEQAKGPIMIQGDHGAVAFRNIRYESFDKPPLTLIGSLDYAYYEGKFANKFPSQPASQALSKGTSKLINYRLSEKNADFLLIFTGKVNCPETDDYTFSFPLTGVGKLMIDGTTLIEHERVYWRHEVVSKTTRLAAGEHTLSVSYTKDFPWGGRALGLFVKRVGAKPVALHEYVSLPNPDPVGDITLQASQETLTLRSFVFFGNKKKTHAINVGSPAGIHYTYDLNQGALLYVWKGDFLNTTDMWYERGEPQTATPMGSVLMQPGKCPMALLNSEKANFPDTLNDEKEWLYKGYTLDKTQQNAPIFSYQYQNLSITDKISPNDAGGLNRRLDISGTSNQPCFVRIAEGADIQQLEDGSYLVDGQLFYVNTTSTASIKEQNGRKLLIAPVLFKEGRGQVSYSIMW